MFERIVFDFPAICIRLFITKDIEKKNPPIERNLNEISAAGIRYWLPKSRLIKVPGNNIINKNRGILSIKIHFSVCLLSSFITTLFCFENSFVINGKNSARKIFGASRRRPAIGTAALYIPIS